PLATGHATKARTAPPAPRSPRSIHVIAFKAVGLSSWALAGSPNTTEIYRILPEIITEFLSKLRVRSRSVALHRIGRLRGGVLRVVQRPHLDLHQRLDHDIGRAGEGALDGHGLFRIATDGDPDQPLAADDAVGGIELHPASAGQ